MSEVFKKRKQSLSSINHRGNWTQKSESEGWLKTEGKGREAKGKGTANGVTN